MKKNLVLMALLFVTVPLQATETWLSVRPVSVYYDAAKLFVINDLLKQELLVQGKISIKMVERPLDGADLESDQKARKEALEQTKTDVGYSGKFSQIDNTVFIYFFKWNKAGDFIYQVRISVPIGEDPEALVKRLATCLITHEKFNASQTSETVMLSDSKQSRRKEAAIVLILRTGILYPSGNSYTVNTYHQGYNSGTYDTVAGSPSASGNAPSFEFGLGYDVNFMIVEGTVGFDGTRDFKVAIGGEYIFGKRDFCPYLGGEIGLSLVNKASNSTGIDESQYEKNSNGMHVGLRAGVLLFRNHNLKFMPEIRAINVFNKDFDKGLNSSIGMMISF
jgi:hypothetical protein